MAAYWRPLLFYQRPFVKIRFKFEHIRVPKFELIRPNAGLTGKQRWYKQVKTSRLKTGTGLAALQETIEKCH